VTHDDGNRLQRYKWLGNIRERQKVIERPDLMKFFEARRGASPAWGGTADA
jgi:DNA-binding NtrC family response regulator